MTIRQPERAALVVMTYSYRVAQWTSSGSSLNDMSRRVDELSGRGSAAPGETAPGATAIITA